ncbi:unnamed protein product [Gordionus sp. m RMFG-2023]
MNADALSRPLLADQDETEINQIIQTQIKALPFTRDKIKSRTMQDPELSQIKENIRNDWHPKITTTELQKIWNIELIVDRRRHNCPGNQINHSTNLTAHKWTPGNCTNKRNSQEVCLVVPIKQGYHKNQETCDRCQQFNAPWILFHNWPVAHTVGEMVRVDLAGPLHNVHWLILVDAYSKWPEGTCQIV